MVPNDALSEPSATADEYESDAKDGIEADVAVVGFGMAGAHATKAILEAGLSVVVIEPTSSHQFLTRLAAVAGGTAPASDASVPISEMFDVDVVSDCATAIVRDDGDADDDARQGVQSIRLENGGHVRARRVVVTAGARPVDPPVPGLELARPLRSADDALRIRTWLDEIEELVIIGGGPTGCQLAGAVAVQKPGIACTLVDGADRLMSSFAPALGRHAHQILEDRGLRVELGDEVEEIRPSGVILRSGRSIDGAPAWTAGYEADMGAFGKTVDGRLRISDDGRLHDSSAVFAAGDCAAHRDGSGELFPMSAQIAAQAGAQVGTNVVRSLQGEEPKPLSLVDRGWVVDLGGGRGVAELLGIPIATYTVDRIVPLLHEAIDYRNLWQLGGLDFVLRFRPGAMQVEPR